MTFCSPFVLRFVYLREFEELINVNPDLYSGHYRKELRLFETEGTMTPLLVLHMCSVDQPVFLLLTVVSFFFFDYRAIEVVKCG